jgi:putative ubiquitin-RnfH superfamily antitoxin RatB of RatAB toxin-antitoxin module
MAHADGAMQMVSVRVAFSPCAGQVDEAELLVPLGTTVGEALAQSQMIKRHPQIDLALNRVGIWGRFRELTDVLRDQDRVEIYRALHVDPKEARRLRYRKHRATGKA